MGRPRYIVDRIVRAEHDILVYRNPGPLHTATQLNHYWITVSIRACIARRVHCTAFYKPNCRPKDSAVVEHDAQQAPDRCRLFGLDTDT